MADVQVSQYIWVVDNANLTAERVERIQDAIARVQSVGGVDIDTLLTSRVDAIYRTPAQMKAHGETLSNGDAAWGYCHSNIREVVCNTTLDNLETQYVWLHELGGHMSDEDVLNGTKRASLMALMTAGRVSAAPTEWRSGAYLRVASECYADTFPRAYGGLTVLQSPDYYDRQIADANFGAYRTIVGGAGGPTVTTLAASSLVAATNIKVTSVTAFAVGEWVRIGTGATVEERGPLTAVGTAGAGGTGLTFVDPLDFAHSSGESVIEIPGPPDPPPLPQPEQPRYQVAIGSTDWTRQIPADSIRITETGSDSIATLEFTYEKHGNQSGLQDNFPWDVAVVDIANLDPGTGVNVRLFGGTLVGATRRHLAGNGVAWDCRAVSYDAWLDRRHLTNWWTTDSGTQTGNKLASDRLIVQRIIADGTAAAGGQSSLAAPNATVKETNAAMPKLQLSDGSLRDHILAVAEAAATTSDPTARRVYVDFFRRVHYFKGNETTAAPYRIGDANYGAVIKATTGLVSYWPMNEPTGATLYDAHSTRHATLSGFYGRGVTPGVHNEPQKRAISLGGRSYASATGAALHPGDTFSVEMWVRRASTSSAEATVWSGGPDDIEILIQADGDIALLKEDASVVRITTDQPLADDDWHHVVITKATTTRNIYVDGVLSAMAGSNATIVAGTGAINIGRKRAGSAYFNGSIQHVALYSTALSAATVLAHYNDGVTVVPDFIDYDTDYNDSAFTVYVKGSTAAGSGWNPVNVGGHSPYAATAIIDRPQSDTAATLAAIASAWVQRDGQVARGGRFQVEGFGGWHAGQTVTIDDAGLGVSGNYEIKQVEITVDPDSNKFVYTISYGTLPWSGVFDVQRKNRKKRN